MSTSHSEQLDGERNLTPQHRGMLLQLVYGVFAQKVIINGKAFSYDWEYAPFTPFAATVDVSESSYDSTVFLYSDQQSQRINISVTVNASQQVDVTLFQFQTVPLTLRNSEVTFQVISDLGSLSIFG